MDSNGCIGLGKITLQDGEPALRMPTGFYPNREIEFSPVSNCNVDFAMLIYNRWGQLIYYGNSGWDGNFDGQEAETGTYSYRVDYSYSLEETIQKKNQIGSFILIR
jgi:gliding motility-associated-like protein